MQNPFAGLDRSKFDFKPSSQKREKLSGKESDVFARNLLEQNPKLKDEIILVCQLLNQNHLELPLIHITSSNIIENGETIPTGFLENIQEKGFRKRHTNVGVFVNRDKKERARAKDYVSKPEDLIKSALLLLQRYSHHGSRTNKTALGENLNRGTGQSIMLIVDGNTNLERGSDYDDHYILVNDVGAEKIIGGVDISSLQPYKEHLVEILQEMLEKIKLFYQK